MRVGEFSWAGGEDGMGKRVTKGPAEGPESSDGVGVVDESATMCVVSDDILYSSKTYNTSLNCFYSKKQAERKKQEARK